MAMKVDVSLCLLVIPIVLSLLLSSHHFAKADNEIGKPLITATCIQTEFPDVCVSTLESDRRSSSANLTGLSRIGLELAITKADEIKADAYKLIFNATSYHNWDIRSACFGAYNLSFYPFKETLQYFDELNYNESYRIVDTFNKGLHYCIDVGVTELAAGITFLTKFTTDVKAILHLLF
ncbi:uncharacterized protein LOC115990163 [Quercus lobata]|uniref:Pectinesterase inhibitor domain-containing protein n=1 Tax=Quercus lobata TaxID=97700 RepID=A0A7N2R4H8_QUELO|nr:uncharacterized protein LOC115990163 [Quercus lobata]